MPVSYRRLLLSHILRAIVYVPYDLLNALVQIATEMGLKENLLYDISINIAYSLLRRLTVFLPAILKVQVSVSCTSYELIASRVENFVWHLFALGLSASYGLGNSTVIISDFIAWDS
jgi:hypothetical protein